MSGDAAALISRRLVIGPGGSGRTYRLRAWVAEAGLDPTDSSVVAWIAGHPTRSPDDRAVRAAVDSGVSLVVVDDLQWFGESALDVLLDAASNAGTGGPAVWASRRPWPSNQTLQIFNDVLTELDGAGRVGLLDAEEFATAAGQMFGRATSSDLLEQLHAATAGSVGLAADAVASNWSGDLDAVPEELVDAVAGRVARCGAEAGALVRLLAVAPELDPADVVEALEEGLDRNYAQRAVRAGGLLDSDGLLIPLVRAAITADLTDTETAELHDRLAIVLTISQPDAAVEHLVAGSGTIPGATDALIDAARRLQVTDPDRALALADQASELGLVDDQLTLVRARAAFELGRGDALAYLDQLGETGPDAAAIAFGMDLRDLRWASAAARPLAGDLAEPMKALADMMTAGVGDVADEPGASPQVALIRATARSVADVANGRTSDALSGFALAADDVDRVRPETPLGATPHGLGGLAATFVGDLDAAEALLTQAIDRRTGGAGEATAHRLLRAYVQLVGGDYQAALEAVRSGEGADWTQRDRFILAAIDAAIARRSGDTTRLRDAWKRADPVLVRQSTSWLLTDLFIELLAAGARLGDTRRVQPVTDQLIAQLDQLPSDGPGGIAARWVELQLAIARDDGVGIDAATAALVELEPSDPRSDARTAAASIWADIRAARATEDDAVRVADLLAAVGDGWEASRILGQAALDQPDPKVARRLLEAARTYAVEPTEDTGGGLLALGLSDREAEVAVLVSEGRTHKEVGAQLYISPKTVEHHVARIRQKLGATSRAELLAVIREATGQG